MLGISELRDHSACAEHSDINLHAARRLQVSFLDGTPGKRIHAGCMHCASIMAALFAICQAELTGVV